MRGLGEHVPSSSFLGDLARVHDSDPVTSLSHDPEVVRDQEQGRTEALTKIGEDAQDLSLDNHIERRRRLVRDKELRAQHEC